MSSLKKVLLFSTVLVFMLSLGTFVAYADETKTGTVTATTLNLRSGPNTSSSIVYTFKKGQSLNILETSGNWYNIKAANGETGWVSSTYVSIKGSTTSRGNITREASSETGSLNTEIASYAKNFLGVKYVWGGVSPKGFDCSGFVKYVFDHFDINIDRVSSSQAGQGVAVSKSDLKSGDLVFFDTNGGNNRINHVGIYIGDGNFIQASSARSAHKVVISTLNSGFYKDSYMRARRLF
jgi:cell wall-associated NlpC family hydrolase